MYQSAPSSFIANAHNELYAFIWGKRRLVANKNSEPSGGHLPIRPSFESATVATISIHNLSAVLQESRSMYSRSMYRVCEQNL